MKRIALFAAAAASATYGGAILLHKAPPLLTVVLQSTDGSSQKCPAAAFAYDFNTVTITGLACPVDAIFKNGFEP